MGTLQGGGRSAMPAPESRWPLMLIEKQPTPLAYATADTTSTPARSNWNAPRNCVPPEIHAPFTTAEPNAIPDMTENAKTHVAQIWPKVEKLRPKLT